MQTPMTNSDQRRPHLQAMCSFSTASPSSPRSDSSNSSGSDFALSDPDSHSNSSNATPGTIHIRFPNTPPAITAQTIESFRHFAERILSQSLSRTDYRTPVVCGMDITAPRYLRAHALFPLLTGFTRRWYVLALTHLLTFQRMSLEQESVALRQEWIAKQLELTGLDAAAEVYLFEETRLAGAALASWRERVTDEGQWLMQRVVELHRRVEQIEAEIARLEEDGV